MGANKFAITGANKFANTLLLYAAVNDHIGQFSRANAFQCDGFTDFKIRFGLLGEFVQNATDAVHRVARFKFD
jgi:hypothetical protein